MGVEHFEYPAHFQRDSTGVFVVTFRDFPECVTQGDEEEDAFFNAREVLKMGIEGRLEDGEPLSSPSLQLAGEHMISVRVSCSLDEVTEGRDSVSALAFQDAGAYADRGVAYAGKGDLDRAIESYDKAIALRSDWAIVYANRGVAYAGKGDYGRAIADFTRVIGLKPEWADAYYNRGDIHTRRGEFDCAIRDYDKAIALNPEFVEAYADRGNVHIKRGDDVGFAIQDFTRAIELVSEWGDVYAVHYDRGMLVLS